VACLSWIGLGNAQAQPLQHILIKPISATMMMLKPRPALPSAHFWRQVFCAALMFWGAMATSKAQVYKWVDANGQAHYSERRLDAGAAKTTVVKIASAPAAPPNSSPSTAFLRAPSRSAQPWPAASGRADAPPGWKPPKALSDGRDHGTDSSRCALAKDVLSGAVRHSNGKPTDQYDRDVAQNDIKAFCNDR